jgi:hypothetical protein
VHLLAGMNLSKNKETFVNSNSYDGSFILPFCCLFACLLVAVVIVVVVVLVAEEYIWTLESVRKFQEAGKNHIMKSFIICFPN